MQRIAVALMNEHLQMTATDILDLSRARAGSESADGKPSEAYVPEGLPQNLKRGVSFA
jgi:hypothetical protein